MTLTTLEELLDKYIGLKGSPDRDAYELELKEGLEFEKSKQWKKNQKKFKENLQKKKLKDI